MNWYLAALKKYATFRGRARRKEFWYFYLFYAIIFYIIMLIEFELDLPPISSSLYSLLTLLPNLAVTIRRLHDTNRSGWWIFIPLIPIIGGIVLLIFMILDGTKGENRFGPDPKASTPKTHEPQTKLVN